MACLEGSALPVVEVLKIQLATLAVNPGDTIVVMHDKTLSQRVRECIAKQLSDVFDGRHKVIILEEGMKIGTIRQSNKPLPPAPDRVPVDVHFNLR